MKKIIVIGAGIAGMMAAALLAAQGNKVTVIERNPGPGGKMNQIISGGFRFDTGPSLVTMPFILEDLFNRCGKNHRDYIRLEPLDLLCRYHFADGTVFNNYADKERTLEEIRRIAPEDCDAYSAFLKYSEKLYQRTSSAFLQNPLFSLSDFRNLNLFDLLRIDALKTVSSRIDSRFKSEYMRMFFKRFTTYNGSSPYLAPATLNVIPHVELTLGGYYLMGGLFTLANALVRLGEELGVEYHYGKTIKRIGGSNRVVNSVVSESGEEFRCDAVFSNSDAAETYNRLLLHGLHDKGMRRETQKAEPSCSGFVIMLGAEGTFEQLAHHTVFFSDDYRKEFDELFASLQPCANPTIYIANTSHTDPDHAPAGMSNLFVLVNAPCLANEINWDSLKEHYARDLILQLENRGLKGLGTRIVAQSLITPADFYNKYRSNMGSIYGTSSNRRMAAFKRPRNKSRKISGLYLVGGSTHPGGGIPLALLSAMHAVELFGRD